MGQNSGATAIHCPHKMSEPTCMTFFIPQCRFVPKTRRLYFYQLRCITQSGATWQSTQRSRFWLTKHAVKFIHNPAGVDAYFAGSLSAQYKHVLCTLAVELWHQRGSDNDRQRCIVHRFQLGSVSDVT